MVLIVGGVLLLGLIILPQFWVKKVFADFLVERDDYPGTAGQFAEHVIEQLAIENAIVKLSDNVNHFDPESRAVALVPEYYQSRSLTALTVAAHELGHLIQAEQGSIWLRLRTRLVLLSQKLERLGAVALLIMPLGTILTRSPFVMVVMTGVGLSGLLMRVVVHLITLPMELDASFGKALPLLMAGEYINEADEPKVRRILWAAALTYVSSALSSLLSLANWLRVLRR
jgi:Zn-dependent membrane protease YugP